MVSNLKEAGFLVPGCVLEVFGAHVHWARDFIHIVCLIFGAISLIIFWKQLSFSFNIIWNVVWIKFLTLKCFESTSRTGAKRLDSASNSKIARTCSRTQFWSIFSNDFHISWEISFVFPSETLRHQKCMFGVAMLSEVADLWCVEKECFAPPLSRLMVEWECPKFSTSRAPLGIFSVFEKIANFSENFRIFSFLDDQIQCFSF